MITKNQRDLGLWACAQIRALPREDWSFNEWRCGTTGCFMGWVDEWINNGEALRLGRRDWTSHERFLALGTRLFGMAPFEFERLFVPVGPEDPSTARQVADRFEAWIRRQEVAE